MTTAPACGTDSAVAIQEVARQRLQRLRTAAERFQSCKRARREPLRDLARLIETDDRGIGRLLRLGVLAGRLAQRLAGLRHVEDVVDHLERQADVVAERGERLEL